MFSGVVYGTKADFLLRLRRHLGWHEGAIRGASVQLNGMAGEVGIAWVPGSLRVPE